MKYATDIPFKGEKRLAVRRGLRRCNPCGHGRPLSCFVTGQRERQDRRGAITNQDNEIVANYDVLTMLSEQPLS